MYKYIDFSSPFRQQHNNSPHLPLNTSYRRFSVTSSNHTHSSTETCFIHGSRCGIDWKQTGLTDKLSLAYRVVVFYAIQHIVEASSVCLHLSPQKLPSHCNPIWRLFSFSSGYFYIFISDYVMKTLYWAPCHNLGIFTPGHNNFCLLDRKGHKFGLLDRTTK